MIPTQEVTEMGTERPRIVLTGATGGIGSETARGFARGGARLLLVAPDAAPDAALVTELRGLGAEVHTLAADLLDPAERARVIDAARERMGGVDVLVNLAGMSAFHRLEDAEGGQIERMIALNLTAPIDLARLVMPLMRAQGAGHIVNVGSIFGSIGCAHFAAYSATKFGLRGFSEALRREVADAGIRVSYVAPRAVRTAINSDAVYRMGEATGMKVDPPARAARAIVRAVERGRKDVYVGWPEALFVRVNALLPRLVDRAVAKQDRIARGFARPEATAPGAAPLKEETHA
jgi:short-subunit dehydrogenase